MRVKQQDRRPPDTDGGDQIGRKETPSERESYVAVVSFPLTAVFIPRALGHRRIVKVAKTLRALGDHLQVGTSVRNVYGDPVNVGGRTVIPIARVSYGFGAGGSEEVKSERGGSGGGAGMSARPVGVLEITEAGTRCIPFIDPTRLGMALVVGFLIGLTIGRRSVRRRSVFGKVSGNHDLFR